MKTPARWIIVAVLLGVYLLAFFAMLHPRVSAAYKSYYIDENSLDWNPEHYPSRPEQGMTFSREGLPDWVETTYGFSLRDPWGRWTDADLSKTPALLFTRPFDGTLCLGFTACPARALIGKTFAVQMGNQTKTLKAFPQGYAEYQVQFMDIRGANRLSFLLPKNLPREHEVDPGNDDARRLGLNLTALRIRPGSCAPAQ